MPQRKADLLETCSRLDSRNCWRTDCAPSHGNSLSASRALSSSSLCTSFPRIISKLVNFSLTSGKITTLTSSVDFLKFAGYSGIKSKLNQVLVLLQVFIGAAGTAVQPAATASGSLFPSISHAWILKWQLIRLKWRGIIKINVTHPVSAYTEYVLSRMCVRDWKGEKKGVALRHKKKEGGNHEKGGKMM